MALRGIDTPNDTTDHAHALKAAGIEAVGFYARPDRSSLSMIKGLAAVDIKRFAIYEKGKPVTASYFTQNQATHDATAAAMHCHAMVMPAGKPIFHCVDYDAAKADLDLFVKFFSTLQGITKQAGFLLGAYGPGWLLKELQHKGIIHWGYLSQSKGFTGYEDYKPHAAIVQGRASTLLHFDIDWDEIVDESVLW